MPSSALSVWSAARGRSWWRRRRCRRRIGAQPRRCLSKPLRQEYQESDRRRYPCVPKQPCPLHRGRCPGLGVAPGNHDSRRKPVARRVRRAFGKSCAVTRPHNHIRHPVDRAAARTGRRRRLPFGLPAASQDAPIDAAKHVAQNVRLHARHLKPKPHGGGARPTPPPDGPETVVAARSTFPSA